MTSLVVMGAILLAAPETELKGFHIYQDELRDALRRESTADSAGPRAAAILDLALLYEEISSDPRLETSDTLIEMKHKLWSRLSSIKRDLERQIARDKTAVKSTSRAAHKSSPGQPSEDEATLALIVRVAQIANSPENRDAPANPKEGARGGGAVAGDWGPALVNLIERTIAPDKWDTVGGPFSIKYYAPLRVLVVRASAEVHNDLGGVLGGLRRVDR